MKIRKRCFMNLSIPSTLLPRSIDFSIFFRLQVVNRFVPAANGVVSQLVGYLVQVDDGVWCSRVCRCDRIRSWKQEITPIKRQVMIVGMDGHLAYRVPWPAESFIRWCIMLVDVGVIDLVRNAALTFLAEWKPVIICRCLQQCCRPELTLTPAVKDIPVRPGCWLFIIWIDLQVR